MIRAYLVDDERLAIRRLSRLLGESGRVSVAGSTMDPEAAVEYLNQSGVDVLFLDIQMPGLSGFELLYRLEHPPLVVFTTAYDAYALEAFETAAVDYLLKPVEPERLDRLRAQPQAQPDMRTLARELAAHLSAGSRLDRLASRTGERTTVLDVARISHLAARDKLTFAVVNGREHVVDYTLAELEYDSIRSGSCGSIERRS